MQQTIRIQGNLVNHYERRFLDWTCARLPEAIISDHLTAFGVLGAFIVLGGYVGSRFSPDFLWLAIAGYVIHWLGDSLDGSLARHRGVVRPRYGYFIDHSLDAFCIVLMVGGLGVTPYVSMGVALFVVVGYFALSIHVFLMNASTGTFKLSFMSMGPTEFRLVLVAITIWMFAQGSLGAQTLAFGVSHYDMTLLVIGGILLALFLLNTVTLIAELRAEEGDGRRPMAPAALESSLRTLARPRIKELPGDNLRPVTARR